MRQIGLGVVCVSIVISVLTVCGAQSPQPRIIVGPNILVSRDGDVAHIETTIATNPRNSKNLVGGSITLTRSDGYGTNKSYSSFDGGSTWLDVGVPEEVERGGGDPQVAFGVTGTAYFAGISHAGSSHGRETNVYRSEDGGKTWHLSMNLGSGDHDMLVTDQTMGPYAGRVYIADERGQPGPREAGDLSMRRRVVLFRSSDDGRSFVGPIEVAKGDGRGLAVNRMLVLSDGSLFIPMVEYPNYNTENEARTKKALFSISTDGGVTFSPKRRIADIEFGGVMAMRKQQKSGRVDQDADYSYAAAPGGKFRDRIYAAWCELSGDVFRLVLTYSSDRGATWSTPKPVDPGASADASQYNQVIAVNREGVLGILFYSTQGFPERDRFDVYFTASVDGGQTFLPKMRVSSETSWPFGSANLRPGPMVQASPNMVVADFMSGFSRWPNGGDYIDMTADVDGVFRPFWPDGRSGTYQLYTAPIRVWTDAAMTRSVSTPEKEKVSLSDKVTFLFDPIRYDPQTRELLLPVRLKNISTETLYPPFTVEIKELIIPGRAQAGDPNSVPVILNAANGRQGVGVTFDYSKALGDLEVLEPGGVTNAVVWRFQAESAVKTDFHVGAEITGFVALKKRGN